MVGRLGCVLEHMLRVRCTLLPGLVDLSPSGMINPYSYQEDLIDGSGMYLYGTLYDTHLRGTLMS